MSTPNPISQLIELLSRECEDATVSVDVPKDPKGEWWLDIGVQKFRTSVSWNSRSGFGVFTSGEQGFGDRPDEIYAKPVRACARICQLVARSRETQARSPMRLKELRHIVGTSQVDLAAELEVNQAAISRMENREDMHISSLNDYIAAMGGELELRARFKDFEVRIEPARLARQKARG
jgi:DNA-binding XRE family transcriptional regulator